MNVFADYTDAEFKDGICFHYISVVIITETYSIVFFFAWPILEKKSAISVEALLGHRRLGKWWVKNPAPTGGSLHQALASVDTCFCFFGVGWGGKM